MTLKNEIRNTLFEVPELVSYQNLQLVSDDKFNLWQSKSFAERQSIFKKVTELGRDYNDQLSKWVAEQMELILAKSRL